MSHRTKLETNLRQEPEYKIHHKENNLGNGQAQQRKLHLCVRFIVIKVLRGAIVRARLFVMPRDGRVDAAWPPEQDLSIQQRILPRFPEEMAYNVSSEIFHFPGMLPVALRWVRRLGGQDAVPKLQERQLPERRLDLENAIAVRREILVQGATSM